MESLFKYLPAKYVGDFVERGEILFRSLSYFRSYEELHSRGDRFEGTRLYRPSAGLDVTKVDTGEKIQLPWAFEATVQEKGGFRFLSESRFFA